MQPRFSALKHSTFGSQSPRFVVSFTACLYYTPSKTARKVLLLFSTPHYEKLLPTTKENDGLEAALLTLFATFLAVNLPFTLVRLRLLGLPWHPIGQIFRGTAVYFVAVCAAGDLLRAHG